MEARLTRDITNIVVVSDLHAGCQMGLCPTEGVRLDDGGTYRPSRFQKAVHGIWRQFWNEFVPFATRREPFAVVCNGDALDGVHHGSTTQISHNLKDQEKIAETLLAPVVEKAKGRYYHIRGTESHVGKSGQEEERIASSLGAKPDDDGRHARWELRLRLGDRLIHLTHHISGTTSPYAGSTGIHREMVATYLETGQWGDQPYSMLVRSHRHRYGKVVIPSKRGDVTGIVTPAWQLKTPFVYRTNARMQQPEIGGIVIRLADDELFARAFVERMGPPREERL